MRPKHTSRRKDAGTRAKRLPRRRVRRARRPSWAGPLRRLNNALASSWRLIDATRDAAERAADRAARCPIRTSRDLHRLSARLLDVCDRLRRAARCLGETTDSMTLAPERIHDAPRLLTEATLRWLLTARALSDSSSVIFTLHEGLLQDLRSGALTAEAETPRRLPRIITVPRIISARDFLLCRRSSAHDRIATIPVRRRRTACRRTTDAPRRISRGRAPPRFSNCLL
ncbi:MAG TPA: hypothetical protein VGF28_13090 [Thermoanaerobaculia bacterium]|jgi:hypothetical protein